MTTPRVASIPPRAAASQAESWQETRAETGQATQILGDDDTEAPRDIGRPSLANQYELFVSCNPAEALQQQFEHLRPHCIAVHDVATGSARKLLAGVAAAMGRNVMQLVIRRQGYGTPLATLHFVELPTASATALRMYATDADAEPEWRDAIAFTLLAHSRLGALMVREPAASGLPNAMQALRAAMLAGPWHNRHLMLLPLASAGAWVGAANELTRGTGVSVRTTPQVLRPAEAWNFISGTWTRLREHDRQFGHDVPALAGVAPQGGETRAAPPSAATAAAVSPVAAPRVDNESEAPPGNAAFPPHAPLPHADTEPMPLAMRPMPQPVRAARPDAAEGSLERYVQQVAELTGMVSCCVFDVMTRRPLAHAGSGPNAEQLTAQGAEALDALCAAGRQLGLGHALPDTALTYARHHLLLRGVAHHPGTALVAVLDKSAANLTLVRLQLGRLDPLPVGASPR